MLAALIIWQLLCALGLLAIVRKLQNQIDALVEWNEVQSARITSLREFVTPASAGFDRPDPFAMPKPGAEGGDSG